MKKSISASATVFIVDLFALWLLHCDTINGHGEIFPVYFFVGCGMLSAVVRGYTMAIIARSDKVSMNLYFRCIASCR